MSKEELIAELQSWLTADEFAPDRERIENLKSQFEKLQEQSGKEQLAQHLEEGEPEDEFEYRNTAEDTRFEELLGIYNDKRRAIDKQRSAEMENNFREKSALVQELQSLIQDEENIGKAYKRFNAIKQKWNEIGPVNNAKRRELQSEYSRLIELFYYNINIYRELQINDLKKNQELKQDVIEKIKHLEEEKSINQVDFLIHQYLEEWDHIGPTFKEEWDKIRDQFKTSVDAVFERIREHRKEVRGNHKENYDKKKALVDRVTDIAQQELKDVREVQRLTKDVKDIQKEWRHIGYAGRGKNDSIWKEFRGACDEYFNKRGAFLDANGKELSDVKSKKIELIDKVKEIYEGDDHERIANQLKGLQRQWKEVGKLLPQEEYRMFKEFRGYCDAFFERKKNQAKALEEAFKKNLKAKEELIVKFSNELDKELEKQGEALIETWKEQWGEIGDVPQKLNRKVEDAFSNVISRAYKGLGISKAEVAEKEFQSKIDILTTRDNAADGLADERHNIQRKIKEAESAVIQLEDKLGFFTYSDDTNPLKKDLLNRIALAKKEVDGLKEKRKQIDLTIKGLRAKEEPVTQEVEDSGGNISESDA
ncbi:MAG: DUF349 domain-containing protein [Flavobacteriales bacterium]